MNFKNIGDISYITQIILITKCEDAWNSVECFTILKMKENSRALVKANISSMLAFHSLDHDPAKMLLFIRVRYDIYLKLSIYLKIKAIFSLSNPNLP